MCPLWNSCQILTFVYHFLSSIANWIYIVSRLLYSLIWFIWSIIKFHILIWFLLKHGLFMQVSSSSNSDSHQWHCRLFLWFLFWKNPFNQVITKENLGGIHWSICYNNDLCVCGKHRFFSLVAVNTLMFYHVYYYLMTNFEEAFPRSKPNVSARCGHLWSKYNFISLSNLWLAFYVLMLTSRWQCDWNGYKT